MLYNTITYQQNFLTFIPWSVPVVASRSQLSVLLYLADRTMYPDQKQTGQNIIKMKDFTIICLKCIFYAQNISFFSLYYILKKVSLFFCYCNEGSHKQNLLLVPLPSSFHRNFFLKQPKTDFDKKFSPTIFKTTTPH